MLSASTCAAGRFSAWGSCPTPTSADGGLRATYRRWSARGCRSSDPPTPAPVRGGWAVPVRPGEVRHDLPFPKPNFKGGAGVPPAYLCGVWGADPTAAGCARGVCLGLYGLARGGRGSMVVTWLKRPRRSTWAAGRASGRDPACRVPGGRIGPPGGGGPSRL